jgi:enoyl-CoA hydratase/carnithine racemase
MKKKTAIEFENGAIRNYLTNNIAVIKFKNKIFDTLTDLTESDRLFRFLEYISKDPGVKALLVLNSPGRFGESEYHNFIESLKQTAQKDDGGINGIYLSHRTTRCREINILDRIILRIIKLKKITFIGLQGEVVTPFFGASLSFDFRFASMDMCFSLAHNKYGLHASGALPFFLPRFLQYSQAIDILLMQKRVCAEKALELGLISRLFNNGDFESRCLETILKLNNFDITSIINTKQLLHYPQEELKSFFNNEHVMLG